MAVLCSPRLMFCCMALSVCVALAHSKKAKSTKSPSRGPTRRPSVDPTLFPTVQPTTSSPSLSPSHEPSQPPSRIPSQPPSRIPSLGPTSSPTTTAPTLGPTSDPSLGPTPVPSVHPSSLPSTMPTFSPTNPPTPVPSATPTAPPSVPPSSHPSQSPSTAPSVKPSTIPTEPPSSLPSFTPSNVPTGSPSQRPSIPGSDRPSPDPSANVPCLALNGCSEPPSGLSTMKPSTQPSVQPSEEDSLEPSISSTIIPSQAPSAQPSPGPSSFQGLPRERDVPLNLVNLPDLRIEVTMPATDAEKVHAKSLTLEVTEFMDEIYGAEFGDEFAFRGVNLSTTFTSLHRGFRHRLLNSEESAAVVVSVTGNAGFTGDAVPSSGEIRDFTEAYFADESNGDSFAKRLRDSGYGAFANVVGVDVSVVPPPTDGRGSVQGSAEAANSGGNSSGPNVGFALGLAALFSTAGAAGLLLWRRKRARQCTKCFSGPPMERRYSSDDEGIVRVVSKSQEGELSHAGLSVEDSFNNEEDDRTPYLVPTYDVKRLENVIMMSNNVIERSVGLDNVIERSVGLEKALW